MLVYFAILLVGLLGCSGLVVDVGRIELRSLQLQTAADSAALSGATEYQRTVDYPTALNAVNAELASFASLNNISVPTATVSFPATTGHYAGDATTFQVKVDQPVSTTLLALIMGSHSTLNASATAVAMIPPCIYLMGKPSIAARGNTNMELNSQGFDLTCPIYSSTGYYVDSFSYIRGWQAKSAGPASMTYGGGWIWPALIGNSPVLADPLAYITAPVPSVCNPANPNITTPFITSGTYCHGMTINGQTVRMQPGLYVICGTLNIQGSVVTGTGVTIYMTRCSGSGFGSFHLENYSTMNVSAPVDSSSGGIPGVLLMTDRSWWSGQRYDIFFDTSTFHGDGLLYGTGAGIYNWHCVMSGDHYFGFVAANFQFQDASLHFSQDYSQLPGGNPFRTVVSLVQ